MCATSGQSLRNKSYSYCFALNRTVKSHNCHNISQNAIAFVKNFAYNKTIKRLYMNKLWVRKSNREARWKSAHTYMYKGPQGPL